MNLLDRIEKKIESLGRSGGAYVMAHATWSACDHRKVCGPSSLEISVALDPSNKELVDQLNRITQESDYCNEHQAAMLNWLHEHKFSEYVAQKVKIEPKLLVDWIYG